MGTREDSLKNIERVSSKSSLRICLFRVRALLSVLELWDCEFVCMWFCLWYGFVCVWKCCFFESMSFVKSDYNPYQDNGFWLALPCM